LALIAKDNPSLGRQVLSVFFINIPVKSEGDLVGLEEKISKYEKIYVFDYLVEITDPKRLLEQKIKSLNLLEVEKYNFSGVGYITGYEKKP